jgi:hypothetical protein
MQIIDKNMARIGGNPDFGTKYKFDFGNEEVRSQALTIRVTPSFLEEIKNVAGDRYRDFCRDAIVEKLGRELAAQTETKTETTELATGQGQQPDNKQTTQLNLELETNPTPAEQVKTPKTRRKAGQTQGHKLMKPTTQTRSQKSSATEKTTEQGQLDTGK